MDYIKYQTLVRQLAQKQLTSEFFFAIFLHAAGCIFSPSAHLNIPLYVGCSAYLVLAVLPFDVLEASALTAAGALSPVNAT